MTRVSDILAAKGDQVHRAGPDTSAYDAIAIMVQHGAGSR